MKIPNIFVVISIILLCLKSLRGQDEEDEDDELSNNNDVVSVTVASSCLFINCINGGTCAVNSDPGNPFCVCPNFYSGPYCQFCIISLKSLSLSLTFEYPCLSVIYFKTLVVVIPLRVSTKDRVRRCRIKPTVPTSVYVEVFYLNIRSLIIYRIIYYLAFE